MHDHLQSKKEGRAHLNVDGAGLGDSRETDPLSEVSDRR